MTVIFKYVSSTSLLLKWPAPNSFTRIIFTEDLNVLNELLGTLLLWLSRIHLYMSRMPYWHWMNLKKLHWTLLIHIFYHNLIKTFLENSRIVKIFLFQCVKNSHYTISTDFLSIQTYYISNFVIVDKLVYLYSHLIN